MPIKIGKKLTLTMGVMMQKTIISPKYTHTDFTIKHYMRNQSLSLTNTNSISNTREEKKKKSSPMFEQ